jgi:molybdopterin converting factor small subunit
MADGMATVFFPSGLTRYTGGRDRVVIECESFRELLAALEARFPGLREPLEAGMAVAIDGEIIEAPLLEPIHPDSEVHFLPRISGG